MKTHVTFATDVFEQKTPQAHFINPCCFGEDCARWLADCLKEKGFVAEAVFQEDWGWCFYVGKVWVGVGLVEEENCWLVFCELNSGFFKKLFGYAEEDAQLQLCYAIDEVLKTAVHVRDIKWYSQENYLRGKDEWTSSPR